MSKFRFIRQSPNKLNMFNMFRLCQKDEIPYDIVAETATLLQKTATMSKQHLTLSKGRQHFTINSFDIVALFCNIDECCFDKVKRCFDIVSGVNGA